MKVFFLIMAINLLLICNANSQCSELEIINQRKTAIVFGEKDYKYVGPLSNPLNDAVDISDSLKRLGFDVFTYYNADIKTMSTAIEEWKNKLNGYDVSLFYYSGHGAEVEGENYLFPIDANPKGISDLYYSAYSAKKILAYMENSNSKVNIMILDACRNNPFRSLTRDIGSGLATMIGKGSFIGFAASPGKVASDGDQRNGLYTEAILKYIVTPNLTIDQIFTRVNAHVQKRSVSQQIPYKNSSLSFDYCFSVQRNNSNSTTISTITQPTSKIALARYHEKIFSSDSSSSKIVVKDSKNLNTISTFSFEKIRPYKMVNGLNDDLYILDTINKSVSVIDSEKGLVKSTVILKDTPFTIVVSNDYKRAYVSNSANVIDGSISVIDLETNKLLKKINNNIHNEEMILSPNGKYLYTKSICKNGQSYLSVFDVKNDKLIKSIENISCGKTFGIVPNGKKIYMSSTGEGGINQTNVIDVNTFKVIKEIYFMSNLLAFSSDSKYIFSASDYEIAIIRSEDDVILNKLPFATKPQGITVSDDGMLYVFLPKENRTVAFLINANLQSTIPVDPEANFKNFKENLRRKTTSGLQYILAGSYDRIHNSIFGIPSQIASDKDMNGIFEAYFSGIFIKDLNNFSYSVGSGLRSKIDPTKKIEPIWTFKFTDTVLIVTVDENKKQEVFKLPTYNIDWVKIDQYVRNYFLSRLNQLN